MKKSAIVGLLLTYAVSLQSIDNPHFYRATYFYGEPRLERPWLSSWDITAAYGATNQSRNSKGQKTCLLNIYGLHNMQVLGEGVPCKNSNDPLDLALINLALVPAHDSFAHLIFQGHFSIAEANFFFTQNMNCGFFFQGHVPFRDMRISDIEWRDCSPTDKQCPNINTPEWQTFLRLFPQILQKYQVSLAPIHKKGFGDTSLLLGWTNNFQDTQMLDYIDTTIKGGILIPTGELRNENLAFDLPLGYNGHIGFPLSLDMTLGCFDWLTLGFHVGALIFQSKLQSARLKTNINQNGFIKLVKCDACVRPGTIVEGGLYAKADHMCRGFSFIAAFSYARQNATSVIPRSTVFAGPVICSDEQLQSWNMSTLNFILEYDLTKEGCLFGPRLGLFYNWVVGGKRIFNTSMGGASFGLDVAVNF